MYEPKIDLYGFSWQNRKGEHFVVAGEAKLWGMEWKVPVNVFIQDRSGERFDRTENWQYPVVLEKYIQSGRK